MPRIVFLHAHPDDEASSTAGSMARAADEGAHVVVVYATNGDHGQPSADLPEGQTVAQFRRTEAEASARVLGLERVAWLGYADSGMTGWEQNDAENAFCRADVEQAALQVAAILDEEDADILVGYDWHGNYGHPDHIQVHRVAVRAAELAKRRPRELQVTMNRDAMRRSREQALAEQVQTDSTQAEGAASDFDMDPDAPADDGNPFGEPESAIHWQVDVTDTLPRKRASMECHRSQTTDVGMFLALPPEVFARAFGTEWYIEPARDPGMQHGWPFAG